MQTHTYIHDNMTDEDDFPRWVDYYGTRQHKDRHCDLLGETVWLHEPNHVLSRRVDAHKREDCPECCP